MTSSVVTMRCRLAVQCLMAQNCGQKKHVGNAIIEDRMAVFKAARAVHRSPAFVMKFINDGLLKAYRRGGPANRPWLAVDLSDLLAVIDRETLYVPPAMIGRRPPKARINKTALHPLAAAI